MESKASFRFTQRAKQDFEDILHYIERELNNPKAASDLLHNITKQIDTIRYFPESAPISTLPFPQTVRKLIVENYIVFYAYESETVTILRIRYAGTDLQKLV